MQAKKLDWHAIFWLHIATLNQVLEKHESVFKPGLGKFSGFEVKRPAKIIFQSTYRSLLLPRQGGKRAWVSGPRRDTRTGWAGMERAAPIVAVLKRDMQSVRKSGDYMQTVNPVAKLDCYTIPRIEDLFAKLFGWKSFSKLDLSQAYLQVSLDEASKHLVVVNTFSGTWDFPTVYHRHLGFFNA